MVLLHFNYYKDEVSGTYYKYIIIIPDNENPRTIDIYYFADEVTVFHNQLTIKI